VIGSAGVRPARTLPAISLVRRAADRLPVRSRYHRGAILQGPLGVAIDSALASLYTYHHRPLNGYLDTYSHVMPQMDEQIPGIMESLLQNGTAGQWTRSQKGTEGPQWPSGPERDQMSLAVKKDL